MGKKQLTTLLSVLGALIVVVAIVKLVRSSGLEASMTGVGEKVLPEFPINDVAKISLVGPEGMLTVAKKANGDLWTVAERDDYPADFSKVSQLLREVWELKFAQAVEAGPSQYGRLGLLDPGAEEEDVEKRGTLLQFLKAEGEVAGTLLIGKEMQRPSNSPSPFGGVSSETAGRYLKIGDSEAIWLVAEPLSSVDIDPTQWISKDFFQVEELKSIERVSRSKQDDWKLARTSESDEWRLLDQKENEVLDDTKIGSLKNAFSSPRFDDVAVDVESLDEDASELVLTTFEGFTYRVGVSKELEDRKHHITLKVDAKFPESRPPAGEEGKEESEEEKKAADEAFAKDQERLKKKLEKEKALEGRVYLVPNFVVSPLLKRRLEITRNPNEPPKPEGPPVNGAEGSIPGLIPGLPPGTELPPELMQQIENMNRGAQPGPGAGASVVTEPIEVKAPEAGKGEGKKGEE